MVDQNLPSNSALEDTINGDSNSSISSMTSNNGTDSPLFRENLKIAILDELIDDCILEICFQVHRSVKIGYSFETNSEVTPNNSKSRANEQITVQCFICSDKLSAEKLCSHLEVCMGITSKRKATQKIVSFTEFDSDSSDSDGRSSLKKKKKGGRGLKNPKRQGSSSSKLFSDAFKDMSKDEINSFFQQHCGVQKKRSKQPCRMTVNCSRHTEEERKLVRSNILSDINDQGTSDTNDQVTCDTNDKVTCNQATCDQAICDQVTCDSVTSDEVIDIDSIDEDIGSQIQPLTMPS